MNRPPPPPSAAPAAARPRVIPVLDLGTSIGKGHYPVGLPEGPAQLRPVYGSETLRDLAALDALQADPEAILSLDSRGDRPLDPSGCWQHPARWPATVVVMTLDRVGAARTGAWCDHAEGEALATALRVVQDGGQQGTTLGELRSRADLVVFVGTDARADAADAPRVTALAAADLPLAAADLPAALQQLAALVDERRLPAPDPALAAVGAGRAAGTRRAVRRAPEPHRRPAEPQHPRRHPCAGRPRRRRQRAAGLHLAGRAAAAQCAAAA
ncbi:hypothetical protein ABXN37_21610 [Piscinibacter sakaiensis]|uniref:hypothetical protein n=1 Tax=Piscinibacter sakaiensis TaxID=1547922 RepID=UPI00372AA5A1